MIDQNGKSDRNFFAHGLKFSCQQGCAACCKIPGWVSITDEDAKKMAEILGIKLNQFLAKYTHRKDGKLRLNERIDHACAMLSSDNTYCMVHAARPHQCRTYPFWDEILVNEFVWVLEQRTCPGINMGKIYTEQEILKINRDEDQAAGYDGSHDLEKNGASPPSKEDKT
ncbi:MAG: YkgJ family cysteine cluster protein [Calditrichaeota bacterium]|nr:MAG: YkgJ family cysteine cluster protein [Calditrichota bacterium]